MMLRDDEVVEGARRLIEKDGIAAECAVRPGHRRDLYRLAASRIDALHLPRCGLGGFAAEHGGKTSHAAIILGALEIPLRVQSILGRQHARRDGSTSCEGPSTALGGRGRGGDTGCDAPSIPLELPRRDAATTPGG